MRAIPILAALLVASAGFTAGAVAAPLAGDATSDVASHGQASDELHNVSVDRLVLAEASATITVDEMTLDRVQTDRGTFENVTLQDATVTVEDATVVVSNVSTEDGSVENAFVHVEEGSVTVEEATATANGAEFSVEDVNVTVENESSSGGLDDARSTQMQVDAEELKRLVEGASVEELSIEDVSADASVVLASAEGVEAEGSAGFAHFGDTVLDSIEITSVSAESASVEDGTLVLEDAEVTVENVQATVDIGVLGMDHDVSVLDNLEVEIDGPVTVERDELRLPLW